MTIEAALDQCLEDIRQHHASLADCLVKFPEYAKELEPMLLAALALEQVPDVQPSAEFKRGLRDRILGFDKPEAMEPIRDLLSTSDGGPAVSEQDQSEEKNSANPVSTVPSKKRGS